MVDMYVNTKYMYASLSVSVMGWDKMEEAPVTPLSLPAFFLRASILLLSRQLRVSMLSLQSLYLTSRIPLSRAPSHWSGPLAAMRRQ